MSERKFRQPVSSRKRYGQEGYTPEEVEAGQISSIQFLSTETGMSVSQLAQLIHEGKIIGYEIADMLFTSPAEIKKYQEKTERKKHLEAMAAGIGANPITALLSIEALLTNTEDLSAVDYTKNRNELDPESVEKIEAIGKWFLSGSEQADQLKFAIGSRVLAILHEDPKSGHFTHLREWVDMYTDGAGGARFDEVLQNYESRAQ